MHERSTDRLFVVSGMVSVVVYDARRGSPTFETVNQFLIGERSPALLVIPPTCTTVAQHRYLRGLHREHAVVEYDYAHPDALDLPYDSPEASQTVPFRW